MYIHECACTHAHVDTRHKPKQTNRWGPSFRVMQTAVTKKSFICADALSGRSKKERDGDREIEREPGRVHPAEKTTSQLDQWGAPPATTWKGPTHKDTCAKSYRQIKTLYDISRWHSGTPASHFRVTAWEVHTPHIYCVLTKSQKCYHSSHLDHVSVPQSQL